MSRLDQLAKLHAADPADADLTYMIALEHAKAGDPETAITWLDKTLAVKPTYCYAFYQKAKMYLEKGEDEQARAVLRDGMKTAATADAHAHSEMQTLLESIG
jgi:tetratricopeptide (TPR) repeat protein